MICIRLSIPKSFGYGLSTLVPFQLKYRMADAKRARKRGIKPICKHRRQSGRGKCEACHIPPENGRYYSQGTSGPVPAIRVVALLRKPIKVHTANIMLGMFVAQLDRSWLETPFIVRGFEISKDSEIALLRKFCKYVFVDLGRSSLPETEIMEVSTAANEFKDPFVPSVIRHRDKPSVSLAVRLLRVITKLDPTGKSGRMLLPAHLHTSVSIPEEIPKAIEAFDSATENMRELLGEVKKGRAINLDKLKATVIPLVESVLRNPDAMAWLASLRKREEGHFSFTITAAVWAVIMGRHVGLDRHNLINLAMGGVLVDIGNTQIPKSIGTKEGSLTEEELGIMQMHVHYGVEIAEKIGGISDDVVAMVRCHHERHDGSGYPAQLAGVNIPVYGRISGVTDCYDAMISRRPHAPAKSSYDAIRELNSLAGTKFQREVVEQFVQALGMFPTGSLVELNTGEVAIVVEQHPLHRLRPNLILVLDKSKQPLKTSKPMALAKVPGGVGERKARWIIQGYEPGAFNIDPKDFFFGTEGSY
jgi:HD-GYP domain-containing protein (c-di-GMP phosphodiesterase class II)